MKFVKGDTIAGLIITAINIIAGIIIGVTQKGMTAGEAVETYSILTIGDGLVSIIPALLMSVCAGLIVTRVASEEEDANLGMDLATQVFAQPKAFTIAGGFIFLIGLVLRLAHHPFLHHGGTDRWPFLRPHAGHQDQRRLGRGRGRPRRTARRQPRDPETRSGQKSQSTRGAKFPNDARGHARGAGGRARSGAVGR